MTAVPKGRKTNEELIDDLLRRVKILESAPRATNTTITNGTFAIQDEAGNLLCQFDRHGFIQFDPGTLNEQIRIGRLAEGPDKFGIRVRNSTGRVIYYVDDMGEYLPVIGLPWTSVWFLAENFETSYADVYKHVFYSTANGVGWDFAVDPNGNTMDYRVRVAELGASLVTIAEQTGFTTQTQIADIVAIPASALLSGTDPVGRSIDLRLEVRKSAGPNPTWTRLITPFTNRKV